MIDTGIDLEHKDLNVDVARSANSWVIAGVDYVAANAASGDAANISLGGVPLLLYWMKLYWARQTKG